MAEILLFHHAQGQTAGFLAFADDLRAAGHVVHAPDLYDGNTFTELDDGVAYARKVGFDTIAERGRHAAGDLPDGLVYAGFSLGVLPAQLLAQTRPGARGSLFFSAAFPPSEFGTAWPQRVPLQLAESDDAELFLYPGDGHLFADSSLPDYDDGAATLLQQRVLAFLSVASRDRASRPFLSRIDQS